MNAGIAAYVILTQNTDVTDIVGVNIFPEVAEQETATPFIVYQLLSVAPEDTHDGPSKLDEVRFEFLCYADSYALAADLGSKVRGALDRVSGTYNGVNVESVQFNDVDIDTIDAPRRFAQVLTFTFRIKRDNVEIAQGTPVTGAKLGDLYDVDTTGVTDGQVIAYDAAAQEWQPADGTGGVTELGQLDDVDIIAPEQGDVLSYNAGVQEWMVNGGLQELLARFKASGTGAQVYDTLNDTTKGYIDILAASATMKVNHSGLTISEASPGVMSFSVAAGTSGNEVEFEAMTIEGSDAVSTVADINFKQGALTYWENSTGKIWLRAPNAGNITVLLPSSGGTLALTTDIPNVPVDSVNGQTGVVVLDTGDIDENGNLYYTEARVAANAAVAANTLKVGITTQQAADITANNAKVGITTQQADDITANNAKVGITQTQADDITANNAKVGITPTQAGEITANTAKVGVIAGGTSGQALVKASGTDYDLEWADAASGVQYHERFATDAETFRSGATATTELYYTAKADGDGLAQSASSDTPTAGKIIKRKIYYSEAAFADPDTGTWVEFTPAPADDASFATVKAALLENLKARTGGTVPISLKQTWEEASATAYLLDETFGSGAAAAYSTRQLRFAQTDCMVIRRASDSTTTTIGFDSEGNIDEAAITTFCTGNTCTVSSWIDQSGNGNDATATTARQPTIYTGGALVKEGGRLALLLDGTDDGFDLSAIGAASSKFGFITHSVDSSDTAWSLLAETVSTDVIPLAQSGSGSAGVFGYTMNNIYKDGSSVSPNTRGDIYNAYTSAGQSLTALDFSGDAVGVLFNRSSFVMQGKAQEVVLYASDKSTDRTSIEENIGDYYTQNTPLLDTYSGAAAAYSLRLLDSTYTGSAIRVRRSSDNTEQDIGFNVFSELDTVSLLAFAGTGDAFVKTWYDQSGNSNDATQTTTSAQPKIVSSGAVITENGKPTLLSTVGGQHLVKQTFSQTTMEAFLTTKVSSAFSYSAGICGSDSAYALVAQENNTSTIINQNSGTVSYRLDSASWSPSNRDAVYTALEDNQRLVGISFNATSWSDLYLGYTGTSALNMFSFQEVILYPSDQSTNRTNIESNIATFYGITL